MRCSAKKTCYKLTSAHLPLRGQCWLCSIISLMRTSFPFNLQKKKIEGT